MKRIILIVAVPLIGAFLWWTISPLFINKVVEDTLDPEIVALLEAMPEVEKTAAKPVLVTIDEHGEAMVMPAPTEKIAVSDETFSPAPKTGAPKITGPFTIEDTKGHPASGSVKVIETSKEQLVRFEDYDGTNGPDLFVYLAKDLDAKEFVSLGRAKGNQGNINYVVSNDVDLSEYKYIMTWCKAFGILFDYAQIN